jgi:hypothetical protein
MKPKFQFVPPAEGVSIVDARNACADDPDENRIDLVVGGRYILLPNKYGRIKPQSSTTATARPKARTVFALSNTAVVGSNPTGGIDVCVRVFYFCCGVGSGLATG